MRLSLAKVVDHPWLRAYEVPDGPHGLRDARDLGIWRLLASCGTGSARSRRGGPRLGHPGAMSSGSSVVYRESEENELDGIRFYRLPPLPPAVPVMGKSIDLEPSCRHRKQSLLSSPPIPHISSYTIVSLSIRLP